MLSPAGVAGACRVVTQASVCAGKSLLADFLELLFRRLLQEDLGNDTVELAADALLPLILAHPDAYQSLGRPFSVCPWVPMNTSSQVCQSCQCWSGQQ